MLWGLVPGHDLATPFVVARPPEVDTTIVHIMSLGKMLTIIRMKVVLYNEARLEPDVHSVTQRNYPTQPGSVVTLASCDPSE